MRGGSHATWPSRYTVRLRWLIETTTRYAVAARVTEDVGTQPVDKSGRVSSPIWTQPGVWLMTGRTVGLPQVTVGRVPARGPPGVAEYWRGLEMGEATRYSLAGAVTSMVVGVVAGASDVVVVTGGAAAFLPGAPHAVTNTTKAPRATTNFHGIGSRVPEGCLTIGAGGADTGAMIFIFGVRTRASKVSEGDFFCPKCGADRHYVLQRFRQWFTLFFLPIVPIGAAKGEQVKCQTCGTSFRPEVLQTPTSAVLTDTIRDTMRLAAVALLNAGNSWDPAARQAAVDTIAATGAVGYNDANLGSDLASQDTTQLSDQVNRLGRGLNDQGKETFVTRLAQIAVADGPVTDGERAVLGAVGSALGLSAAHLLGIALPWWSTHRPAEYLAVTSCRRTEILRGSAGAAPSTASSRRGGRRRRRGIR